MYLTWRHETGRIIARFTDRVHRRLFWLTLTRALTSKSLKSPLGMRTGRGGSHRPWARPCAQRALREARGKEETGTTTRKPCGASQRHTVTWPVLGWFRGKRQTARSLTQVTRDHVPGDGPSTELMPTRLARSVQPSSISFTCRAWTRVRPGMTPMWHMPGALRRMSCRHLQCW